MFIIQKMWKKIALWVLLIHILEENRQCLMTSSNRWQAIPVQPVWRLIHPEGKPAATHQAAHRRKTLQMPLLQLRLPPPRCSHWSFAHSCWYDSSSHSFLSFTHFPRTGLFPLLWWSKSWTSDEFLGYVSVWGRPLLKNASKPVQSECLYCINHLSLLQHQLLLPWVCDSTAVSTITFISYQNSCTVILYKCSLKVALKCDYHATYLCRDSQ